MKPKYILKNIALLLAFLISGISAGMAVTAYLFDTYPLMDQSTVPENPAAIIILPFLALVLCTYTTAILGVILFCMKKNVKLSLLLFCKKENKFCTVLRGLGYLIIARLVYESICDALKFRQFFANWLWYYASAVIFVLSGMIILISIAKKRII